MFHHQLCTNQLIPSMNFVIHLVCSMLVSADNSKLFDDKVYVSNDDQ